LIITNKENVMKRVLVLASALFSICVSGAFAAASSDAKAIIGTWKAVEGTYSDGAKESDIGMSLTFTAETMTDPMSKTGEAYAYKLDAKSKTIAIKNEKLEMKIVYTFKDAQTLVLTELTVVKSGKTTSIIGSGASAMFVSLAFKK
jgi:hypothetical protein